MTSTAAREKQALRQQCGGTLPEQPSAIEKDAGGEIPPGLLGVPQWTRTSSAGQEYNCMSHHSVSFTQCQRRLPFEILTSSQKGPGSNIHAVCHGQSAPSSDPQPTFRGATTARRGTSIPSPHHLKLSSRWKRKTVGNKRFRIKLHLPSSSLGASACMAI